MPSGIRATVSFPSSECCPVADLSAAAETTIVGKAATVCPDEATESVSEFTLEADHEPGPAFIRVFSHGASRRYRLSHEGPASCPCECLGTFGCPVVRYVAREGTLTVVFHAADYDALRAVVADLRDRFPSADIKRFVRSPAGADPGDSVLVRRGRLTDRQLEVLETAVEMGYFERPRRANATEVAESLDIDASTFAEHLAAAQRKLLGDVLDGGS